MLIKLTKLFGLLLAALVAPVARADEDVTTIVTKTNYITPDCFKNAIDTALGAQPSGLSTGIKVVFVNAAAAPADPTSVVPHITYVTTSDVAYTVSNDNTVYTTSAPFIFTTTGAKIKATDNDEDKSTVYEYETATDSSNVFLQITKTAQTTTETIFKATESPTTIFEGITVDETITSTQKNPLVTGEVVTKTRTNVKTIDTDSYTKGTTIVNTAAKSSSAADPSDASADPSDPFYSADPSDPYSADPSDDSFGVTSTIDLRVRVSDSSSQALSTDPVFSNSSYSGYSSEEYSLEYYYSESSYAESSLTVDINAVSSAFSSDVSSAFSSAASSAVSSSASSSASSSSAVSSSASQSSSSSTPSTALSGKATCGSGDIFEVISTASPLSVFNREELPLSIPDGVDNDGVPFETNKFYANLFLDDQTDMIWTYPYGMYWKKVDYYGFAVQHTNPANRVFGPKNKNNDGDSYFYNPVDNAELIFSSTSLSKSNNHLGVTDMKSMSAKVTLSSSSSVGDDYVEIPVVQGMGFVTAIYHGDTTVLLNSLVGVDTLDKESSSALPSNVLKYRATLFTDTVYLIYVTLPSSSTDFKLSASDSYNLKGSKAVDGLIVQIAVAPSDSSKDSYYDEAAGKYAVSASVQGTSACTTAEYSFDYKTEGTSSSGKTILFALPHHVQSLSSDTASAKTPIQLTSTTKGNMTAFLANSLSFNEDLNSDVSFLPWAPIMTLDLSYDSDKLKLLASSAADELNVDIDLTVAGMDSNYYSGKVIDKYANILLVVHDILGDEDLAKDVLKDLKQAFKSFTSNTQYYPLIYDTKFGGVTSSASQGGDTGADYGSGYYNDHHFHYGYFVHAAAVVGYVDNALGGSWADDNKDWVNALIRDVANPSEDDGYFPVSRMFDWYAGHSWAAGLFSSGDGKNEESSSEDYHFSYGMKLWGNVIGDSSMESRGDLMLAIQKRAMNNYFYYKDDNEVVPSEIVPNKVSGILFDNKIAFTTYFGDADDYPQYVHGIHMIPMTAATALIRETEFVKQEWNENIDKFVDNLDDGWAGIIRSNQALFDPSSSYDFFSSDDFKSTYLDNGQSRTWNLAFAGGIQNSS